MTGALDGGSDLKRQESSVLEAMRRNGDALPAHTEHVGNQLLGHDQLIRLESAVA